VILKPLQNVFSPLQESLLFALFRIRVVFPRPTRLSQSRNLFKVLLDLHQRRVLLRVHGDAYGVLEELLLLLEDLTDFDEVNILIDVALHVRGDRVVFDVAFPPASRHPDLLLEALLSEILNRVVISVSHEVLDAVFLGVVLQVVHQPRSVAFYLLVCYYCQKRNLVELLLSEWPEDTSANDCLFWSLLLYEAKRLVMTVHDQLHYVVLRHARKLLGYNRLELNKLLHAVERLVVLVYSEEDAALLLKFSSPGVSFRVANSSFSLLHLLLRCLLIGRSFDHGEFNY